MGPNLSDNELSAVVAAAAAAAAVGQPEQLWGQSCRREDVQKEIIFIKINFSTSKQNFRVAIEQCTGTNVIYG